MTAPGHRDLPGELGNAHTVDATGSGQKTTTGLGETGIDPRIETGLPENESGSSQKAANARDATAHGKRATATMTAFDALDLLTANGKRSESGHENYPTVNELSYPSVLLDPKIGNHQRITRGSGPPKPPSVPHVVERAARNGERQPRKRSGQGKSAATKQLHPPQLPKELKRRERARAQQTTVQRHSPPPPLLAGPRSSRRGGSLPGHNTRCTLLSCPPEGWEKEEEEVPGCETPEGVSARGEANGAGGTEPEGREGFFRFL